MVTAYIGIGSNMGDRLNNGIRAAERIAAVPGCRVVNCSEWFLTKPVGVDGQEWYMNGVLAADSEITPGRLLGHLLEIEKGMGRLRKERWGPRTIDLDLLLFGDEIVHEQGISVPHPLMHLRRFVLVPLVQLAPALLHPVLLKTMTELLHELPEDGQDVVPWKESRCCA
jgi:2-amino-4-hydroxy-6-hydroxymethyldihydropteridine diphosphokinase